jgi:hypothetical protein
LKLLANSTGSIGLFMVGIFGPFFIHSSFIFNIILIPFFQKNETENERKMKRKMNIFDKMEPCPRFCKKWWKKWSFFGFLAVFLTHKMHFYIIFLNFGFQGVHGNHSMCKRFALLLVS